EGSLGAGFNVYAPGNYRNKETGKFESVKTWAFAVKAGSELEYEWPVESFEGEQYHLRVYGPNGFYREFKGEKDTVIPVQVEPGGRDSGKLKVNVRNRGSQTVSLRVVEDKYNKKDSAFTLKPGSEKDVVLNTTSASGWYDFSIQSKGSVDFLARYAGRLETGSDSISDPFMGAV
ncbi:MAG: DUF756 domain-containing protein, partial [Bacteroidota bacterium]|nr:DUF756 domain-containing protein [Bacteroidota bacterium]